MAIDSLARTRPGASSDGFTRGFSVRHAEAKSGSDGVAGNDVAVGGARASLGLVDSRIVAGGVPRNVPLVDDAPARASLSARDSGSRTWSGPFMPGHLLLGLTLGTYAFARTTGRNVSGR